MPRVESVHSMEFMSKKAAQGVVGCLAKSLDCKSCDQCLNPGCDRAKDHFSVLCSTCADLPVPVSHLCAQHALKLLCMLKIPHSSAHKRMPNRG